MKSEEIRKMVDLFIYLVFSVLPLLGIARSESQLVTIALIAAAVILFTIFGYKVNQRIQEYRIHKSSMSNNSVIKNARRYCKTLLKYAKANKKQLLKNKKVLKAKRLKAQEDLAIRKIKGDQPESKRLVKIQRKLDNLAKNMSDDNALSLIQSLSPNMDYQISQLLSKTFVELERILLNAEQFDIRIKFGQYIKQFSDVEIDRIQADIDYMGWTYMMMGYQHKAEKVILSGIKRANYLLKKDKTDAEKYQLELLMVRGYRHLGSARMTYEKNPEEALKHLNDALKIHKDMKTDSNVEGQEAKYIEMSSGIMYGLMVAELYLFKGSQEKGSATDDQYKALFNSYEQFKEALEVSNTFDNKHRYTKYLVLKTKYLEVFLDYYEHFKKHLKIKFDFDQESLKEFIKDTLENIREVFKQNIFMDEALEYYLEERVKYLKHEIIDTIKGASI